MALICQIFLILFIITFSYYGIQLPVWQAVVTVVLLLWVPLLLTHKRQRRCSRYGLGRAVAKVESRQRQIRHRTQKQ